jgi:anti-anti-sigma factor
LPPRCWKSRVRTATSRDLGYWSVHHLIADTKGSLDRGAEFWSYARSRRQPALNAGEELWMEIQKERVGDTYVVSANGRLDGIYSAAFAKEVGELIVGTNPKILIDFAEIDFVTSAGIRAVLLLMKKAEASGVVFALCGVNSQVREVLDVAGLAPIVTIHSGRSEGLAALNA